MTQLFHLPENHTQRFQLHNEVHARAPINLKLPVKSSFFALSLTSEEKKLEREHLAKLCDRYGLPHPQADSLHFSATLDSFRIRWEQHSEFSSYSFYVQNISEQPFVKLAIEHVPVDWLKQLPGQIIVAAHAAVIEANHPSVLSTELISAFFSGNSIVGAEVTGGAAHAFTDFRIHADGFSRFN